MKKNNKEQSRTKCYVTITFSGLTAKQLDHLYKAEEQLGLAGISFDRGGYMGSNATRDWEFDFSLSKKATVWLQPTKK